MLKRHLTSVILIITLLACSEQSPMTNVPEQKTPQNTPESLPETSFGQSYGLMELSFQGIGTNKASSSIDFIEDNTDLLSTEAVSTLSKGIDLKFLSFGSFDVGTRGIDGTRYLYVTYAVRNAENCNTPGSCPAYANPISNLTFVATDTSSSLGGTPFGNFFKFDFSPFDAATSLTYAENVRPTHGMRYQSTSDSAVVVSDNADLQVFTQAELDALTPKAGETFQQYGYVARSTSSTSSRALAASPAPNQYDGVVTFAVKLPLQANPANDPYGFTMLLSATDDTVVKVTESPEEQANSKALDRATALGTTTIRTLAGSTLTTAGASELCPVRVSGDAANTTGSNLYLVNSDIPCSNPNNSIFWSANHESGDTSEWELNQDGGAVFNSGTGVVTVSDSSDEPNDTDVAKSGTRALEMTVSDTNLDQQGARIFRTDVPYKEAYYSAWYYFPTTYVTEEWWNIFQFKSKVESTNFNEAVFSLNVDGNPSTSIMQAYLFEKLTNTSSNQPTPIPVAQWVHLEVYYKVREDATGSIAVWQDGIKILDLDNVQTNYPNGDVDWSLNNYTFNLSPDPATIYIDDAVISSKRIGNAFNLPIP